MIKSRLGERFSLIWEMPGLLVQEVKTATRIANKIVNFFTKDVVLVKHALFL